jgi:hypothetical protein
MQFRFSIKQQRMRQANSHILLFAGLLLEVGGHPEGPATDQLDTGFLFAFLQMLRRFPNPHLLLRAFHAAPLL